MTKEQALHKLIKLERAGKGKQAVSLCGAYRLWSSRSLKPGFLCIGHHGKGQPTHIIRLENTF